MDLQLKETLNGGDFVMKRKEIWVDVIGYEGYYQVSSNGRVRGLARTVFKNGKPCKLRQKKITLNVSYLGYVRVILSKQRKAKTFSVHRLVAIAFIENPLKKPQVNHKNNIRSDNRLENLEWATSSENIIHKFKMGYKTDSGALDSQSKSVEQLDLHGNIIKIFGSMREAERESKVFRAAMKKCIIGRYSQAGGFIWRLTDKK